MRRAIEAVLADEPRPGAPAKFSPEQVTQILAVACEPPEKSGRPITHWTAQELTDEVIRRGIVPSISPSQVSRYLREAALQPHKSRYWLNTTEKDPTRFEAQVKAVCDTYLAAPQRERIEGTHTVCVDEMTGLQALERIAPSKAMIAGKCQLIEFEYERHGTLCLIGNFVVTTGELLRPTIGPTRTEADFAGHIEQTVAADPEGSWVFVVDNLNIHCSESLVKLVAGACEVATDLGKKGVRGVLKSVASRQAFLSESGHGYGSCNAEAQLVAEPDRGDLRCDHAEGDPAWLVQLGGGLAHEVVELHQLFQSRICQAVPLDVHGSSADEGSGVKLGEGANQGTPIASSLFNYGKAV